MFAQKVTEDPAIAGSTPETFAVANRSDIGSPDCSFSDRTKIALKSENSLICRIQSIYCNYEKSWLRKFIHNKREILKYFPTCYIGLLDILNKQTCRHDSRLINLRVQGCVSMCGQTVPSIVSWCMLWNMMLNNFFLILRFGPEKWKGTFQNKAIARLTEIGRNSCKGGNLIHFCTMTCMINNDMQLARKQITM